MIILKDADKAAISDSENAKTHLAMAEIYQANHASGEETREWQTAVPYLEKCMDKESQSALADTCQNLSAKLRLNKGAQLALQYANKGLAAATQLDDKSLIAGCLAERGMSEIQLKKYKEAETDLQQADDIWKHDEPDQKKLDCNYAETNLARALAADGQYAKSESIYKKVVADEEQLVHVMMRSRALREYADVAAKAGHTALATQLRKRADACDDSPDNRAGYITPDSPAAFEPPPPPGK
jgi:tetratricopeptide (TPR) repeat protein